MAASNSARRSCSIIACSRAGSWVVRCQGSTQAPLVLNHVGDATVQISRLSTDRGSKQRYLRFRDGHLERVNCRSGEQDIAKIVEANGEDLPGPLPLGIDHGAVPIKPSPASATIRLITPVVLRPSTSES